MKDYKRKEEIFARLFSFFVVIAVLVFIGCGHEKDDINTAAINAKMTIVLQPTIKAILPYLKTTKTNESHFLLSRPYVLAYAGGWESDGNPGDVVWTSNPNISTIKTVVFFKDTLINSASYDVIIMTPNKDRRDGTVAHYQLGYYLWAFDIKTKELGFSTYLTDPALKSSYSNDVDQGDHLSYHDFCLWADTVTDQSIKGKQHLLTSLVKDSDREAVKEFIKSNPRLINIKDDSGETILHWSIRNNYKDIIGLALSAGADVNSQDADDRTPLSYSRDKDLVKLLLADGANANARDADGRTPLFYAVNKDVAALLVAHGANVNAKDRFKGTPLFYVDSKDVVEFLINQKAEINARNSSGQTPLLRAVSDGNLLVVESLLTHKADVNVKDDRGKTALFLATEIKNLVLVRKLIEANADINAKEERGITPLQWATLVGYKEIADFLSLHGGQK